MPKVLLDTNIVMDHPDIFDNIEDEIIINSIILEELDNIMHNSSSEEKKYKARQGRNAIKRATNKTYCTHYPVLDNLPVGWDTNKNDNKLLLVCKDKNYILYTNDLAMQVKAEALGVQWRDYKKKDCDEVYTGYKIINLTEDELATWYQSDIKANIWDLEMNQYGLLSVNGKIVDKIKRSKHGIDVIKYKTIQTKFSEKIKPRQGNIKQELAFDMLQDPNTHYKCLAGCWGSGKDYLMINYAISLLEQNKYEKIVWIVQNQQVSNTKDIGALPGELSAKLAPFTAILADKVGGQYGLDMFINNKQIEIVPLAFIRGRSFNKSILMLSEAENITKEHMQLIMSRLEDNSMLMINGDFKQTDKQIFKENSGLKALINGLKGHEEFGYIMLDKTERSKLAEMASLLD